MAISIMGRGCIGEFGQDVPALLQFVKQIAETGKEQLSGSQSERNFDVAGIMGDAKYNRISDLAKYAVKSSNEAITEAGLVGFADSSRIGIFMGTAEGTEIASHKFYKLVKENGYKKGNPLLFPETALNVPASYVSIAHKITGPIVSNASGFAAGHEVLEIAMNYLISGTIDAAVTIYADEVNEFLAWKAQKKGLLQNCEQPAVGRASCLVIKSEDSGKGQGVIRSISFANVCTADAVNRTINEVLQRADITAGEVDLVIRQDNSRPEQAETEANCLRRFFLDNVPFIHSERVLGKQPGDTTLLVIIWATLLRQYPNLLQSSLGDKAGTRTILLTSLSPAGNYGAMLIEI